MRVLPHLRVCVPNIQCIFADYCSYNEIDNQEERYVERTGHLMRSLVYSIVKDFNITRLIRHMHKKDNKTVDEIQDALQNNECDVGLLHYNTPILLENITQGPVVYESKLTMTSAYKSDHLTGISGDALDSLSNFSHLVFVIIFAFSLIIGLAIYLNESLKLSFINIFWLRPQRKKRLRKSKKSKRIIDIVLLMLVLFFKIDLFPSIKRLRMKILWCCFTAFGFYVSFYYSSMIKTEAVTVKTPKVAMTYQDIIDMNLDIMFDLHLNSYLAFKSAPSNSLKGKIWEKKKVSGSLSFEDILEVKQKIVSSKTVYIADENILSYFKYGLYSMVKQEEETKLIIISDPLEQSYLRAADFNAKLNDIHQRKINRRASQLLQANLWEISILKISRLLMFIYNFVTTQHVDTNYEDFNNHVSQNIILPQPVVLKPDLHYFKGLLRVCGISIVISMYVLIYEHLYYYLYPI